MDENCNEAAKRRNALRAHPVCLICDGSGQNGSRACPCTCKTYPPIIIALNGVRGSGKDTVGKLLVEQYGFTHFAFADPLKRVARKIWAFTDEQLWGPSKKRDEVDTRYPLEGVNPRNGGSLARVRYARHAKPTDNELLYKYWIAEDGEYFPQYLTPRLALQILGDEYGRRFYKNVWVDRCFDSILRAARHDDIFKFVITDCRYPNEIFRTQELNGYVIRLLRGWEESEDEHPSEMLMKGVPHDKVDHVLDNRGDIDELPRLVKSALAFIHAAAITRVNNPIR